MFDFITDESFDIEKTKQYSLSIQVSLDGFSFLAFDPTENRIVALKNTPLKISSENLLVRRLKEWLETEVMFSKPFNNVRLYFFTEHFVLVPEEFAAENNGEKLNSALFQTDLSSQSIENKIEKINARLIFQLPPYLSEVLHPFFNNNFEIIHPVTKLLESQPESNKRNCAVIITTKKYFLMTVTRNNKLLLANSFPIVHQNDLVYNVLNAFQQLGTARNETQLFVADALNQNSEVEELLKPYFQNINNLKTPEFIANPEIANHSLQLYLH